METQTMFTKKYQNAMKEVQTMPVYDDDGVDLRKSLGRHTVEVVAIQTRDPVEEADKDDYYAIKLKVLESTNPEVQGEAFVNYKNFGGKLGGIFFLKAVSSFVAEVMGVPQNELTLDHLNNTGHESQPLAGQTLTCISKEVTKTKKDGSQVTFTDIKWKK